MKQVVTDIFISEGLRSANVYLIRSSGGLTLVDTGMKGEADEIAAQIQGKGFTLEEVRNIVLTHGHGDHAGNAADLSERTEASILAHEAEAPFLDHTRPMPEPTMMRIMNKLGGSAFDYEPIKLMRRLKDEDRIRFLNGWHILHTPGHTPGSICLYEQDRHILICGDTLFNKNPVTGKTGVSASFPVLTQDKNKLVESLKRLSTLTIDVICFGHGDPLILKDCQEQIKALLIV
jgi:glyoxylase-like metal-dependent hydrolase (beta-lactamase superfamily II)